MIDQVSIKNDIIAKLKTLPLYKVSSNGKNHNVLCPYCGDSPKRVHGHFAVFIDTLSDSPMLYRCLRCNESGVLTAQVLEDLDIVLNKKLTDEISYVNKHSGISNTYFKDKPKKFIVPVPKDSSENAAKLDYINTRLGLDLSYEEIAEYKIILSLAEFMRCNNIKISKEYTGNNIDIPMRSLIELENNYIGFLSSNNNKITFRDFTPDQKGFFGRYYKLTIDIYNQSPNTFYGLKNQFDLLYNENIDIHIAEGTFDILSVYKNLQHKASQNSLFFASCGYGFSTILKYLVFMGVTTDITLHIYSDADKTDYDHMKNLKRGYVNTWLDNVIIHRNSFTGEKDFGVPRDRIKEYQYKLKL